MTAQINYIGINFYVSLIKELYFSILQDVTSVTERYKNFDTTTQDTTVRRNCVVFRHSRYLSKYLYTTETRVRTDTKLCHWRLRK
jgi:hypothetical protein